MKVYIGPYRNWWGPYQLANLLQKVGVSDDRCDKIGEWLSDTWVDDLCQWIDSKEKRKIKVRRRAAIINRSANQSLICFMSITLNNICQRV